ncbi:MFS transporter [Tistrella sp. BH-R2-4]|uniref:MFS transporter n=1 Tax=Tistrella arctica TaxID=3133430 RepID=A0ABU9YSU1_9PROT
MSSGILSRLPRAVRGDVATASRALTLGTFLAASAAPTPLYRLYQQDFALPPVTVTVIFGVYALALLITLLVAGSLSDHLGRRPVVLGALALELVAMALFLDAGSAGLLIAARLLQGVATGLAASALGAALIDGSPARGALINSIAPMAGMATGALGTAILVSYAPLPLHLVFVVLVVLFAGQMPLIWLTPETAGGKPGLMASLRPRIAVPAHVRAALLRVTPVAVAVWAVGGLYLSLVPSLIQSATGSRSHLIGGLVVAGLTSCGGLAILSLRNRPARRILIIGTTGLTLGTGLFLAGINLAAIPLLLLGTVIAGYGFGAGFLGALRTIMPMAAADERAGLLSAFYVECYLSFCVPAVLAGLLAGQAGLVVTATVYGAVVMLLAGTSLILVCRQGR